MLLKINDKWCVNTFYTLHRSLCTFTPRVVLLHRRLCIEGVLGANTDKRRLRVCCPIYHSLCELERRCKEGAKVTEGKRQMHSRCTICGLAAFLHGASTFLHQRCTIFDAL